MGSVQAKTTTRVFTKTRIAVVEDQFNLMLRYSSMDGSRRERILNRISQKKVDGLGLYIEDEGFMLAEVSLVVDWNTHENLVNAVGSLFDTSLPGWEDNVCPEVWVAANRIANEAKDLGKRLRTWIRFSSSVYSNLEELKAMCEELGFSYGGKMPGWKAGYVESGGKCPDLSELSAIIRGAK